MNWTGRKMFRYITGIGCSSALCYCVNKQLVFASEPDRTSASGVKDDETQRELQLKHVEVYFRHGARTPIHIVPALGEVEYSYEYILRDASKTLFNYKVTDLETGGERQKSPIQLSYERKKTLKGGGLLGALTNYGQHQMYTLGKQLRQDYQSLLSTEFNPDEIYFRSTNIDRTVASLRCVLAGLYGVEELNSKGPINIPVSHTLNEVIFPNGGNCPVVRQVNHAAMIHFDDIPGFEEDRKTVERALGIDSVHGTSRKLNFIFIRDDLVGRMTHGYNIPDKVKPYMDMIERNAVKMMYYAFTGQHEAERQVVLRLTTGRMVKLSLDRMQEIVEGKGKHKMCMYSTHDSTLVALLSSLDIFDHKWPPFAADLRLELYEDTQGKHWVKVLYCGKEQIPRGCKSTLVPYEEFQANMNPMSIEKKEYDKLCHSKILEEIAKELVAHEKDEVEDEEDKEDSDKPAGM